ncbi:hypothetical protein [Fodinibius sp. Rm-B-1B1-1]|uniref:hypothetical protein n=1 Tax=Fodinibius alkaliphilus TaxID=3140241 RepID=UPI003159AD7D
MLPRSSQTNRTSTIPAAGSIHPLQEYLADVKSQSGKEFPDIDEDDAEGNGEQHSSSQVTTSAENNGEVDFNELVTNKDFSELFRQFFVVGHKELVILKSKIFSNRDMDPDSLLKPSDVNAHKIQALRKQLYKLQMTLFKNPKGRQYDTAR